MEIVLGSLIDWLHKKLKNYGFFKWLLIAIIFGLGCWIAYREWLY